MGKAMAELPYIKEYTDDCGIRRRYFRRKGFKGGALPGKVGSSEFMEAYQAFMAGKPAPLARGIVPGTFASLFQAYYRSVEYANLKPASKKLYRYALNPMQELYGHKPLATMNRDNVLKIIEKVGDRAPQMANLTRSVLKRVLGVALSRNLIRSNP